MKCVKRDSAMLMDAKSKHVNSIMSALQNRSAYRQQMSEPGLTTILGVRLLLPESTPV